MRLYSLFFLAWIPIWLHSVETERGMDTVLKDEQVQFRHIEGKGIGYDQGYTTIQAFFTPHFTSVIPLLDFRGHVFDNGKFAANAGLGFRYLNSRVFGINVFYDYRQTHHFHYNQVGCGLEVLGKCIDFRINGYFPIGKKQNYFHASSSTHKEHVLKGLDTEIGIHGYRTDVIMLYGAMGAYYVEGKSRNAWGGRARFSITFLEHMRFEVNGSYDPIFQWIGQGQISLMYFFGPRMSSNSLHEILLKERSSQWIDRAEIIIIDKKR